jgi:hypothetical protein
MPRLTKKELKDIGKMQQEIENEDFSRLEEFRTKVSILVRDGDPYGMIAAGYAIYLRYPGYEYDRALCLDYFIKGYEMTRLAEVANVIGYIYYYGVDGDPNYFFAQKYFKLGAEEGIIESMYKLGDILLKGLGGTTDIEEALLLYKKTYWITYTDFFVCNNGFSNFADTALRIGNCYLKGYIFEQSDYKALIYYIQGKYALEQRKSINYIGDGNLTKKNNEKIEIIRQKLGFNNIELRKETTITNPSVLELLNITEYSAVDFIVSIKSNDGAKAEMVFKPHLKNTKVLVTFPFINYCELLEEVKITIKSSVMDRKVNSYALRGVIIYIKFNYNENYIALFYKNNIIKKIYFDSIVYKIISNK